MGIINLPKRNGGGVNKHIVEVCLNVPRFKAFEYDNIIIYLRDRSKAGSDAARHTESQRRVTSSNCGGDAHAGCDGTKSKACSSVTHHSNSIASRLADPVGGGPSTGSTNQNRQDEEEDDSNGGLHCDICTGSKEEGLRRKMIFWFGA